MHVSLNSLMLLCHKAALGAGAPLGAAEDLGNAAVWLALRGFPVLDVVYDAVSSVDAKASVYGECTTADGAVDWRPGISNGKLSALLIGGAAADLFSLQQRDQGGVARLNGLDVPLLQLVHFVHVADGCQVLVRWSDERSSCEYLAEGARLESTAAAVTAGAPGRFLFEAKWRACGDAAPQNGAQAVTEDRDKYLEGLDLDAAKWRDLRAYAERTLVEPTARSRVRGAGAGVSDND